MAAKNNSANSNRISDLGTILTTGTTGFVVRKRTGVGMVVHLVLLTCMVILGTAFLVYYKSMEGCVLAVVIGLIFVMIAHNLEKLKKVKHSLEFMNALFSSALGKGYQFCCVVKSTGDIVFYNRPFQSIFPAYMAQKGRKLETLLSLYEIPDAQREALNALMASNSTGSLDVTLSNAVAATALSLTLHLEPIDRPTGFFLLRGK